MSGTRTRTRLSALTHRRVFPVQSRWLVRGTKTQCCVELQQLAHTMQVWVGMYGASQEYAGHGHRSANPSTRMQTLEGEGGRSCRLTFVWTFSFLFRAKDNLDAKPGR
ncbi:hypothetical protein I7I48_02218 [Histoplasma ohiense]|nr:hypothetical protein I7I48_02218 [Histoplasma ohiense (nom. inval.)]